MDEAESASLPVKRSRRIVRRVLLFMLGCVVLFVAADFDWGGRGRVPHRVLSYEGFDWPVIADEYLRAKGAEVGDVPPSENAALEYVIACCYLPGPLRDWDESARRLAEWEERYALRYCWPEDCSLLWSYLDTGALALEHGVEGLRRTNAKWYWRADDGPLCLTSPLAGPTKNLGEVFILAGRSAEFDGDGEVALACYLVPLRLANHRGQGEGYLNGAAAVGVGVLGLEALDRWILTDPSADLLRYALERLEGLEVGKPDFSRVLRYERVAALDAVGAYGTLRTGGVRGFLTGGGPVFGRSRTVRGVATRKINALYDRIEAWTSLSGRAKYGAPLDWERVWGDAQDNWWTAVACSYAVCPATFHRLFAFLEVHYAATKTRIGLALYKAEHARYPEKLDEIEPYIGQIPLDPYVEEPFHYRVEGDDYVFYSVGPDLTDNGGVDAREDTARLYGSGGRRGLWHEQADLIFPSKLTPPPSLEEYLRPTQPRRRPSAGQGGSPDASDSAS